jgi:hypothetical protein
LFNEHGHPSDQDIKERLKKKLESDEYCNEQLRKLNDKEVTYDKLWSDKLYSAVSTVMIFT